MHRRFHRNAVLLLAGSLLIAPLWAVAADQTDYQYDPALFGALEWRNVGPYRGGRVTAVTGVRGQPHLFYFGSVGGGVWKTENAGASWQNISDGFFKTSSVGAISVANSDSNVIFVGMGEAPVRGVASSHGNGVYKSTDAGKTWAHMGLEETRHISAVRVHPSNPDIVYVAAQGATWIPTPGRGIYRSVDGGASWEKVLFVNETSGASDLSMDTSNPRILYAAFWDHQRLPWQIRSGGPGSGIYKSSDAGETWQKLDDGLPTAMGKIGIAVSPVAPDRVWAMIEAEDDEGGVYRSDDAGLTWTRINADRALRARAWYYTHIFADPQDEETVYVLAAPMMKSTDGGKTFTFVKTPHIDNHGLWINPDNNKWMINSNDGGANVSLDGGRTWSTQANQPTAQLYRVIADNRFPYRLYAGQQDNTTLAIASRSFTGGIGRDDWYPVGGGEAAHIAFDPDDPELVYATHIMGVLTEYEHSTGLTRNISPYPMIGLGTDVQDFKYRFNWNGPVLVSVRDRSVIYHGANVLLMSTDRGQSWSPVSPDLTRNEADKHVKGGVPYTNEAAGAEIYNTIMYVTESPHERGTLWVGTDDGLVQLTRNSGETWRNVTPKGLDDGLINAIEISPHDPARIYIAVTRYKFGDLRPMIYRTKDYGGRWRRIDRGLPSNAFVRVVREDPGRQGLLYAGTETGLFVSFDDGNRWQPLQLNLPVSPITDLRVHQRDIVVSTQGRGFWILDNPAPLRQVDEKTASSPFHLYKPAPAYQLSYSEPISAFEGQNPADGAVLYYYLKEAPDADRTPVEIAFLDQSGHLLRRLGTVKDANVLCTEKNEEADIFLPPRDEEFTANAGMNRLVWDFRRTPITCIPDLFFAFGWAGPRVVPGTYTVRLSVGEHTIEQPLQIMADPRLNLPRPVITDKAVRLDRLYNAINDLHNTVLRLQSIRGQAESRIELTSQHSNATEIRSVAQELITEITATLDTLIQQRQQTPQDVANYPNQLNAHLVDLMRTIDSNWPSPTEGMKERMDDLLMRWTDRKRKIEGILSGELKALNRVLAKEQLPTVYIPGASNSL